METKRAKVIMLPTENYSFQGIIKSKGGQLKVCRQQEVPDLYRNMWTPQHLYITTNDKIKEGDWTIEKNKIVQVKNQEGANWAKLYKLPKIIATTDKSLTILEGDGTKLGKDGNQIYTMISLPQPSQAFIEKYCKEGGIDEVLIEYTNSNVISYKGENGVHKIPSRVKVDSHNTITIHPIKDSWSKEEVKDILYKAFNFVNTDVLPAGFLSRTRIDDWVKENL